MIDEGRARQDDSDDVEPDEGPVGIGFQDISASSSDNVALFFWANGTLGTTIIRVCTCFDFDKDEHVTIPGNEIDFPGSVGEPEPASDDVKTLLAKVPVRNVLASFTGSLGGGEGIAFAILARGIDQPPN